MKTVNNTTNIEELHINMPCIATSSGLTRIKSQTMDKAYRKKLIQQADDARYCRQNCGIG